MHHSAHNLSLPCIVHPANQGIKLDSFVTLKTWPTLEFGHLVPGEHGGCGDQESPGNYPAPPPPVPQPGDASGQAEGGDHPEPLNRWSSSTPLGSGNMQIYLPIQIVIVCICTRSYSPHYVAPLLFTLYFTRIVLPGFYSMWNLIFSSQQHHATFIHANYFIYIK